ncbi:MAG: hypothetical protein AAGL09_05115 [Pseudomonadota bacterium]
MAGDMRARAEQVQSHPRIPDESQDRWRSSTHQPAAMGTSFRWQIGYCLYLKRG